MLPVEGSTESAPEKLNRYWSLIGAAASPSSVLVSSGVRLGRSCGRSASTSSPLALSTGLSWSRVSSLGSGLNFEMAARYAGLAGTGVGWSPVKLMTWRPPASPSPAGWAM